MGLLERDDELAAIRAVVSQGGVLVIDGGAGIGKTSLLNAACEAAADAGNEVLRARGSELESGFAFGVVLQLFERRVAEVQPDQLAALFVGAALAARPLVTGQAGEGLGDDTSFAVLHGLYWLAANLATSRPLVIAVDDAHWADPPSLRWLAYLAPRVEGLRLSLLVSLRPTERASQETPLLKVRAEAAVLQPRLLSEGAVAEIVRGVTGTAATERMSAAAWRQSGGNPFYLHELLRAGDDPGLALTRPGLGLVTQVAARIRRLDAQALHLAQALAVLGDGCQLGHAARVAELDVDTAAHLAAGLVRLEVLAGDDPPHFLHPVLREAAEASLASDEREAAHKSAARLLHAEGAPPGKVAAHLMRVRPVGDGWVPARLSEAARAALAGGAPQAAADLLGRALEEPPSLDERASVLREAARAEALAGQETACARLEEARQLVHDPRERAEIGLELAQVHANLFDRVESVDVSERALTDLGGADPELQARLKAQVVLAGLRDARRASRVLPLLEELAADQDRGAPVEAFALPRAMRALWIDGRPAAEVAATLGAALTQASEHSDTWDNRGHGIWALIIAEGFTAADALLTAMLAEVERTGDARGLYTTYGSLGLLKLRLGALPEADAAARIALRVLQGTDLALGLPVVVTALTDVAVEAGQLDEAQSFLDLLPSQELPPRQGTVQPVAARGRLRLAQGRPADALIEFERASALFGPDAWGLQLRDNGVLHARSGAATALVMLGDHARARELAGAEVADARAFAAPRALGIALRAAGMAHGGKRGLQLLEESVAVLRTSPALLERAHSLAELGAALRRAGHRAVAREPLTEALDLAARCGARPLAARAREELRATGARPRSEWRTGLEALTPSELRVARLAAEGRTNREIAQALYVTLKTVESHLAKAYGKLGIAGRAELALGLGSERIRVSTL